MSSSPRPPASSGGSTPDTPRQSERQNARFGRGTGGHLDGQIVDQADIAWPVRQPPLRFVTLARAAGAQAHIAIFRLGIRLRAARRDRQPVAWCQCHEVQEPSKGAGCVQVLAGCDVSCRRLPCSSGRLPAGQSPRRSCRGIGPSAGLRTAAQARPRRPAQGSGRATRGSSLESSRAAVR